MTVTNGGSYASTGPLEIVITNSYRIACDAAVSGAVADTTGPPRGDLGTARFSFPQPCTGPANSKWRVVQSGIAGLATYRQNPAGLDGKINNLYLRLTGDIPGVGSCTVDAVTHVSMLWKNPPNPTLTLTGALGGGGGWVEDTTCPTSIARTDARFHITSGAYNLNPAGITITSPPASEIVWP
jgi:hypothetical protein